MDSRTLTPTPPRTSFSSLLLNADWRISRAIYWVFTWLCLVGLMALGIYALVECYKGIFEYQDAWYDLSLVEWSFFGLAILLVVRLIKLTHLSGACWSYSLNSLLKILGLFVVIKMLLLAVAAVADEAKPIGALQLYFQLDQLYGATFWLAVVSLSLYMAAPPVKPTHQTTDVNMSNDADNVRHEPVLPEPSELNVLATPTNQNQNKDAS